MPDAPNPHVQRFLTQLDRLLRQVAIWVAEEGLISARDTVHLNEETSGRYEAPKLWIRSRDNQRVAELEPVGAYIIGAAGRVDLRGLLGSEPILYLLAGGPTFTTRIAAGEETAEVRIRSVFDGVDREGWYSIGEKQPRSARALTRDIFLELLTQVSTYGAP